MASTQLTSRRARQQLPEYKNEPKSKPSSHVEDTIKPSIVQTFIQQGKTPKSYAKRNEIINACLKPDHEKLLKKFLKSAHIPKLSLRGPIDAAELSRLSHNIPHHFAATKFELNSAILDKNACIALIECLSRMPFLKNVVLNNIEVIEFNESIDCSFEGHLDSLHAIASEGKKMLPLLTAFLKNGQPQNVKIEGTLDVADHRGIGQSFLSYGGPQILEFSNVNFKNNDITACYFQFLKDNSTLISLKLINSPMFVKDFNAWVAVLQGNSTLEEISMRRCEIGLDESMEDPNVAALGRLGALRELNLSGNYLSSTALQRLYGTLCGFSDEEVFSPAPLERLQLTMNKKSIVEDRNYVNALSDLIYHASHLTHLWVPDTLGEDRNKSTIVDGIYSNKKLRLFILDGGQSRQTGFPWKPIPEAIRRNREEYHKQYEAYELEFAMNAMTGLPATARTKANIRRLLPETLKLIGMSAYEQDRSSALQLAFVNRTAYQNALNALPSELK